ncbi:hypothetical protein [Sulfobacillus thermosulfidooxidans]|uniref:hypothetical protein n=1 Tax=Sulfobacillus thermosulfidooxidans TaxID=28034 RepID=UPI0006B4D300|nr:hypothetical protein [Sulfobacillus thermosulfidooxidans]
MASLGSKDSWDALILALTTYREQVMKLPQASRNLESWEDDLALRWVVGQHTPARLHIAKFGEKRVLWFELGQKHSRWEVEWAPLPEWIDHVLVEGGENFLGTSGPNFAYLVWTFSVYNVHQKFDGALVGWLVKDVTDLLNHKAKVLVRDWRTEELRQWAEFGWREWSIPSYPSNVSPCSEVRAVGRFRDGDSMPVTVEDLFDDIQHLRLLQFVPQSIWSVFNRAVKLYVYGYLDWEFFAMSQHHAVMALETSLKYLFLESLTSPVTLELTTRTGQRVAFQEFDQSPTTYNILWNNAHKLLKKYSHKAENLKIFVNGNPFPRSKGHLRDWAYRRELLSESEQDSISHYFRLRDQWSHPEFTQNNWISDVFMRLMESSLLINRMWARVRHPEHLLWDHAFLKTPRWAKAGHAKLSKQEG